MKPTNLIRLVVICLLSAGVITPVSVHANVIPNAYIVQVQDTEDVDKVSQVVERLTGGRVGYIYKTALKGFSIHVPPGIARSQIQKQAGVVLVEPDLEVYLLEQTLPTGVDRIDAEQNGFADIDGIDDVRVGVDVAIIDTGIDVDHPDLNVVGGTHFYTVTTGPPSKRGEYEDDDYDDTLGHGTHVAGTVAALDNDSGVVGVAPGARLWAVRVIDESGTGSISKIIKGVDWVTERAATIAVANMSLGTQGISEGLHTAIRNSVEAGIVYVVAAGNSSQDIYGSDGVLGTEDDFIPAAYPEVAAISAMADYDGKPGSDSFAGFSNYGRSVADGNPVVSRGRAIDLLMPGVNIYSTVPGGYGTKSGTSMASPHAAGLAALYIAANGAPANAAGVYQVRQALINGGVAQDGPCGIDSDPDPDGNLENIGWAGPDGCSTTPLPTLRVASVTYGADGGKNSDRNLLITVTLDPQVAGAYVSIWTDRFLGDKVTKSWASNGATGTEGVVTFTLSNAPSGYYETTVIDVVAEGMTWDGDTPENSFTK